MFAPVLGLATRKLDIFGYYQYVTGVNNINLLPNRDQVKTTEKTKYFAKWGLILGVVLLLIAGAWLFFDSNKEKNSMEEKLSVYDDVLRERDAKQAELDELNQAIEKNSGRLAATSDVKKNSPFLYDVMMHINDSVISGLALDSLSYTRSDGEIKIEGRSVSHQNIIAFTDKLNAGKLVERASLQTVSEVMENGVSLKSFSLRLLLVSETLEESGEKKE